MKKEKQNMTKDNGFKDSIKKSWKSLSSTLPVMIAVVMLISLINTLVPKTVFATIFGINDAIDSVIGASLGSILAGNPINSYIIGGELLDNGVGLIAVTAFIVAWVTVGIIQLPIEIKNLGKRFAITRNIISFIFSIIVAITTMGILRVI